MKRADHQLSLCGGCGAEERFLLHSVRHRSTYRRLCTDCLLKNHHGLFCPFCFHVYVDPLPPHQRLLCLKCPSISHLSCVPSGYSNSPPSFLCPSCSSPNFSFFNLRNSCSSPSGKRIKPPPTPNPSDAAAAVDGYARAIDKDEARALVAAAKIAAVSMTKAAAQARVEAEQRVKEAALAKKRAREALERLAYLTGREKEMKEKDEQLKVNHTNGGKQAEADDGGALFKEPSGIGAMEVHREEGK